MKRYLVMTALLLGGLSCSREEAVREVSPEPEPPFEFRMETLEGDEFVSTQGEVREVVAGLGFEDTKTQILMEGGGTSAGVYWSSGDQFRCLYRDDEQKVKNAVFTTYDDKVKSAAFSTVEEVLTDRPVYCHYPISPLRTSVANELFCRMVAPEQNATPGGVEPSQLISFAYAPNLSADLTFRNITCLVRFRLSGDIVRSVTSVQMSSLKQLSGNFVFGLDENKMPVMRPEVNFSGMERYSDVTLKGTFTAGDYYYIAIVPQTLNGFELTFSDDSGNYTTKISTKTIEFPRSKIVDLGVINLGDSFATAASEYAVIDYPAIQYKTASKGTNPVTIAVVPDGFTAQQMNHFEALAKAGLDALFATEPYKSYEPYFNAWILRVNSKESGAKVWNDDDHSDIVNDRDCYFESIWGATTYNGMRLNSTKLYNFVETKCPDVVNGIHSVAEVPVLVIINDSRYGGICHFSEVDSHAYCMAPYAFFGESLSWNYPSIEASSVSEVTTDSRTVSAEELEEMGCPNTGDWRNTLVHEYGGHAFARLADEYWYTANSTTAAVYPGYTPPFGLNLAGSYGSIPWQHWLDRQSTLVASDPHYSRIGIYQGGQVYMSGRWRNERISCMIDNRFYFSAYQRELIVRRIFDLSGDTFDFEDFLAGDKTDDPVRDIAPSVLMGSGLAAAHMVPPLPPPVFDK